MEGGLEAYDDFLFGFGKAMGSSDEVGIYVDPGRSVSIWLLSQRGAELTLRYH